VSADRYITGEYRNRGLTFKFPLQPLRDIVRDLERRVLVHDNVDLDVISLACMVCSALLKVRECFSIRGILRAYRVDLDDAVVVVHRHVHQLGHKVPRRCLANQQPHLLEGVCDPREQNEQGDQDGTDRIQIPDESLTNDGHDETKGVDGNIVAVVDVENVHRGVLPVHQAVEHQRSLGADGDRDEDDGNDVQRLVRLFTLGQTTPRLDLCSCLVPTRQ
jgi:hypothetical protein